MTTKKDNSDPSALCGEPLRPRETRASSSVLGRPDGAVFAMLTRQEDKPETKPNFAPGTTGEAKIYIVGAGPGDPELLTIKGMRLLERAQLVIYAGSLVNGDILGYCRKGCRVLDSASMTLEEQVDEMAEAARAGKLVVRLHTGDPSLYGAIAEQISRLRGRGAQCEIIPGVSSLQGAAARLGIEYTIPGGTQTLICTRVGGRTPVPEAESLEKLASHGATIVLFLSSDRVGDAVESCVKAGCAPETPAAWIYRATWPDEKRAVTTLGNLAASMQASGITKHALIVIGECLDPDGSARSLLYHPGFSHGERP